MKRSSILFMIVLLVIGLFVALPMGVYAKTINLRVASWMPAKSVDSDVAELWTKMITEKTNGMVKFTIYKASALGFFKDHYDMARDCTDKYCLCLNKEACPGCGTTHECSFSEGCVPA